MAVLAVEYTFPAAPITSVLKRMVKGMEHLYYARLFLNSPTYADGRIWHRWHEMGFHVATFAQPPGTAAADRVRIRLRAPSVTPVASVESANVDALKDLESMVRAINDVRPTVTGKSDAERATALRSSEVGRLVIEPLEKTLGGFGLEPEAIADFVKALQRGFDALTNDDIQAVKLTLS